MNNKDKVWFLELVVKAQKSKIERAIEFIEKEPIDDEIEYTAKLLDILEGKDETNN